MKGFLIIGLFFVRVSLSSAQNIPRLDSLTEFSISINTGYLKNKCLVKNYDFYEIRDDGQRYYTRLKAFDEKYASSFKISNYKTLVYPDDIIRKNVRCIFGLGFSIRKKYGTFKFNLNYIQRDFTDISASNNGFLSVIDNYKNHSIYGNMCNIYRYNSDLIECPITYGIGVNRKHFLLNFNVGLNSSIITKEQTYHRRTYYDASSRKYTFENPTYLESEEIRFYKINLVSSVESGVKVNSFAITLYASHDSRPFWQTTKTLEIIRYTKSTAGLSLYYFF